jgi:alkylation response protein AidB-like acyl-CoA dehydrogenase
MVLDLDGLFLVPGNPGDEYGRVCTLVRQWADKEVIGKRLEYHQQYPALFTEKLKVLGLTMGLQRIAASESQGGFGWSTPSHAPDILGIVAEISRADASAGIILAVNYAIMNSLAGQASSQDAGLPAALTGPILSDRIAFTSCILPGAGFAGEETPLFKGRSLMARLDIVDGEPVVSGKNLRPITGGALADLFCVVCSGEGGLPALALVPGNAKGVTRGSPIMTTGLNACANAEINFDRVKIPGENLIADPGAVEALYSWINLLFGGTSLGAGLNFFEILSEWGEVRVIKGFGMLKENPLCASVLADVAEELACTRLLLLDLAHLMATGKSQSGLYTYAGMIGARAQQSVMKAINRGLELMGSAGYAKEWHTEKHWRDVKTIGSALCGVGAEAPSKMDTARFFYHCTAL